MTDASQILIVEDDVDLAEMLDTLFQDLGYEVSTTHYGEEALVLCEERMPEVVILDIYLPDINGYEVCRRLRNNLLTKHIAVILLTQRTLKSDKLLGLELGAVDYITKPFDTEELKLRVQNTIRGIQHKRSIDGVTGLPRGRLIEEQFRFLLRRENWALMYMGISGFGPFKEAYGLESAKTLLRITASTLLEAVGEVGTVDDFVGHVGEDDFVVTTVPARAQALMHRIKGGFKSALKDLDTVIEQERVRAIKKGRPQDAIPLLDLFIGLLTSKERDFTDIRELAEAAAKARRRAEKGLSSEQTV
ncbi:MAG: response regulator [Anaerolineales bacterium]|nr:MAG: response regulator [Anaerolineales bacterium]